MKSIARVVPGNSLLMIVDVQTAFQNAIYRFQHMSQTCNFLLSSSKILNFPVVVTEQYPKGLGHTVPDLDISGGNVKLFEKSSFSAITGEVKDHISSLGLQQNTDDPLNVIVCGIEGHVCVLQTCLDLLEMKWNVHIVADGISSSSSLERGFAFDRLRDAGCCITTAESIVFQMMRSSKHENFKQMSSLIKERNELKKHLKETF